MTTSELISLLTSMGACLAAIAAFMSVREAAKHRKSSYRPEVALSRTAFETNSEDRQKTKISSEWKLRTTNDAESKKRFTRRGIPMINIGLGAAKNLWVAWSFPIERTVEAINRLADTVGMKGLLKYEDGILSSDSELFGTFYSVWTSQKEHKADYLLPATIDSDVAELCLPHAFIVLTSAFIYFTFKADNSRIPKLTPIRIRITYSDIADQHYSIEYILDSHITEIANNGDKMSFGIILEPQRTTSSALNWYKWVFHSAWNKICDLRS